MKQVIEYLRKTTEFKQFEQALSRPRSEILVHDASEEVAVTMIMDAWESGTAPIFVVLPNLFKAQQMYDRLSLLVEEDQIGFFPQDEFITTEMLVSSHEFKMERINAIRDLLEGKRQIIVTHTAGIVKAQMPALLVVPGVIMALALVPANYLLYRGMAPKPSLVIPASFDAMKGKKTNLFLILLVYALPLGIIVGALSFVAILINSLFVAIPIMLVIGVLSLYSALHLLALLISFARQALEKPAEQPQPTIPA